MPLTTIFCTMYYPQRKKRNFRDSTQGRTLCASMEKRNKEIKKRGNK